MMYGDKEILREQYPGMKAWLEYIRQLSVISGKGRGGRSLGGRGTILGYAHIIDKYHWLESGRDGSGNKLFDPSVCSRGETFYYFGIRRGISAGMLSYRIVSYPGFYGETGLPAMCALFFNILYGIVDRDFLGRIASGGETALASIGISL